MNQVSLEVFPKGDDSQALSTVSGFLAAKPAFVSATDTRKGGFEAALRLSKTLNEQGYNAALHFTGGDKTPEEAAKLIDQVKEAGINRIVVIRGDRPAEGKEVCKTAHLVLSLRCLGIFKEISVAGYPDVHPEAGSPAADLKHLDSKLVAGAHRVITQFSYNADKICKLRDAVQGRKPRVKFSAGLLPIRSLNQVLRFASKCGAKVDDSIKARFADLPEEQHATLGHNILASLTEKLVAEGVDIHYYTLNSIEGVNEAWLAAKKDENE